MSAVAAAPAARPKLVVGIIVDQLRYDYLTRFRPLFDGGFARLLEHGAVFTNARYEPTPPSPRPDTPPSSPARRPLCPASSLRVV